MAYGTKYQANVWDFSGNTFTVNLKKKSYTGATTTLTNYSTSPLNLNYRGGRDQLDNTIKGSDVDFTFYVHSGENFDELMSSNYKDWQLEILQAVGSTTIVSGATSLLQDTSTGAAWSNGGTYMYNTETISTTTTTTTTLAPNTFNGAGALIGNGSNGYVDNLTNTNHLTLSRGTIPINDTGTTTITPASSLASTVTGMSFIISGNTNATPIHVSPHSGTGLFDNTAFNLYNTTVLNNNSHAVTVLFAIPSVAGHNFTLNAVIDVSGNTATGVTVTIEYESGTWTVTADKPIIVPLTFTNCTAFGYITSSTCSGGADDSDSINTTVLPANTLSVSHTTGGLSCADLKYRLGATVTINGTSRANGATFTLGSQHITVNILNTTCSAYPC